MDGKEKEKERNTQTVVSFGLVPEHISREGDVLDCSCVNIVVRNSGNFFKTRRSDHDMNSIEIALAIRILCCSEQS